MYIIVEARTRYVDGFYSYLQDAKAQCRQLSKDFPEGSFFVCKVTSPPSGYGLRLGGSNGEDFSRMVKIFGYDS